MECLVRLIKSRTPLSYRTSRIVRPGGGGWILATCGESLSPEFQVTGKAKSIGL